MWYLEGNVLGMFPSMFPYSWDETNISGEIKKKSTGSCCIRYPVFSSEFRSFASTLRLRLWAIAHAFQVGYSVEKAGPHSKGQICRVSPWQELLFGRSPANCLDISSIYLRMQKWLVLQSFYHFQQRYATDFGGNKDISYFSLNTLIILQHDIY